MSFEKFHYALCEDCVMPAIYNDFSAITDAETYEKVAKGLEELGNIAYDSTIPEDEFSHKTCDCCGSTLAGRRVYFTCIK